MIDSMGLSPDTALTVVLTLLPLLSPLAIALAIAAYHLLLSRMPAAQAARVEHQVALVVSAVEQTYAAVPGSGAYKKAEALRLLEHLGVRVDPKLLDVLVESAVGALARQTAPVAPRPTVG